MVTITDGKSDKKDQTLLEDHSLQGRFLSACSSEKCNMSTMANSVALSQLSEAQGIVINPSIIVQLKPNWHQEKELYFSKDYLGCQKFV